MNVIDKIEQLRQERGWTKYKLAEEAMLNHSTLSAIYSRETPPKLEVLEMICKAFGITLSQFFSDEEKFEPVSPDEQRLLELYRALPDGRRKALLALLGG